MFSLTVTGSGETIYYSSVTAPLVRKTVKRYIQKHKNWSNRAIDQFFEILNYWLIYATEGQRFELHGISLLKKPEGSKEGYLYGYEVNK